MIAFLRISLAFVLLLSCWAERPGDFRIIGPGGGGAQYNPTVSPQDLNTVLISCDMTGAYITHDGGRSWRMFNLRGTVKFFAFDPSNPKTIYAEVTGLWRSTDDGVTWKLLYPKPAAVRGIQMDDDHADESIVAQPNPLGRIVALAIDPADSKVLYAAAAGENNQAALFISHDAGENWERQASLAEVPRHLWVDPNSPATSRIIYACGAHHVGLVSGGNVDNRATPSQFTDISMGFEANASPVIYATSKQGGFVSADSGKNWQKCTLPGSGAEVRAVATSLHHPQTAYISYGGLKLDGKTWMGVAKTSDSGRTWTLVWKDSNVSGSNVHDAWVDKRFGPGWGENPLTMGAADQDANVAYGTDLGRTMRTSDGGVTWQALYSREESASTWTTTGLDVTTTYGIHFDPFDPNRQFITYTDIGLFRSEDGGKSWQGSTEGVPRQWVNTTYWVVFDPKVRGRMWSVNSYTHDLPRPKMFRHNSVLNFKGGVCRSDDGGKTWVKSNAGMEPTGPTHLLLDPTSSPDARVLYVAAFGRGVYKSVDDGKTWKLKNNGIKQKEPFAWRLTRDASGTLYVVIARRSEDGSIGGPGDGALYKSTDGAETWTPVQLPEGVNGPNGLAIDPKNPERLYLAAWARAQGLHGESGGIYLSENGGKSWRQVLDRDRHIYDVTVDERDPRVLYAAGFESSVWRSADRGEHWTRVPGFNFKWGHRVIPDPADANKVYVTTFGGSVWHGSVNGAARPVDIATPEMEPGR